MVGYVHNNIFKVKAEQEEEENLNQDSLELKKSNEQLDLPLLELEDISGSFVDSLLDFSDWVEDNQNRSMADVVVSSEEKPSLGVDEKCVEMEKGEGNLGSLIEEEMGKVSLGAEIVGGESDGMTLNSGVVDVGESSELRDGEENGVKTDAGDVESSEDEESEEEDSSEEEEEESSSESSCSSSDDEDDEEEKRKEVKVEEGEVEMEEGEIRDFEADEMVAWSDDEDGNVAKGPIRSKNEVQELPPVPPVDVTIGPHHQMLPVGVVLSIMGAQVIVEGVEKHNPLSEGSILWITESRSPLGIVDEIFGPVKNPYYMVRYNSESEVPSGIQQGSLISFVPEFADYVLKNNNLYKKGYDASGENDEELSDEVEFSDDEKEAEYKRMLKMSKRGSNEQKNGNMKKDKKSKNRGVNWKADHQPSPTSQSNSTVQGSYSGAPASGSGMTLAISPGPQPHSFAVPPSGIWKKGIPSIQPHNIGFSPNGFPPNLPFMQQNFPQQPFQNLPLPNTVPFHPQFNTSGQILPSNFVLQGMAPNLFAGPAFASWPPNISQNAFSLPQVGPAAFQGLISNPSMNLLPQGLVMPNGLQMENNSGIRPPMSSGLQMQNTNGMSYPMPNQHQMENKNGAMPSFASGSGEASQNPSYGNGHPNHGGRRPFQRGGGRFRGGRGGRGRQQSR